MHSPWRTCARIGFESAFFPLKRQLTAEEQSEAGRLFAALEGLLEQSGGPYLFGSVSLADMALTPTVIRLVRHDVELDAFPRSREWTAAVLAGPHVSAWLVEADRLPPIWFDAYLTAPAAQASWRLASSDQWLPDAG